MSNRVLPSRDSLNLEQRIFYTEGCEERFKDINKIKVENLFLYWNGVKWEFNFYLEEHVRKFLAPSFTRDIVRSITQLNTPLDVLCNITAHFLHNSICIEENFKDRVFNIIISN